MDNLNDTYKRVSKIRELMKSRHLTQEQLANALNYDPRTIRRRFKDGIRDVDELNKIAKFIGVQLNDILYS
jgi:transcriptional regulator with XRE-family HTH domain